VEAEDRESVTLKRRVSAVVDIGLPL